MLVSTTLAGPGAEASIVDALRSAAPLVDYHLIAFSGADRAAVERVIEANYYDGLKKVIYREYPWPDSYGKARTEMLRWAESFEADWALTVDCDERLAVGEHELETLNDLIDSDVLAVTVKDRDMLYQKPRFLRCGAGLAWQWPCAERLVLEATGEPPPMLQLGGTFWELPKDEEAEKRRARRGIEHMPAILTEGENAHARRHLAECHLTLGELRRAQYNFERVWDNREAPRFERTWSAYRLAELACLRGDYADALVDAGAALAEDPGLIQELGWVMAHANAKLKNFPAAALWCTYVLNAPIDESRGGHRGVTWKQGATELLTAIEAAAQRQAGLYTPDDFKAREDQRADYALLARELVTITEADSALDLGAGDGRLVDALRELGVSAWGVEASENEERPHMEFGRSLETWGESRFEPYLQFPLVTCVEVAEHLPPEQADAIVDACCVRSHRWIYFSAAQPGQGGLGHINEQPVAYWKAKFLARGWTVDGDATQRLIDNLAGVTRCWWLPRNALILKRS